MISVHQKLSFKELAMTCARELLSADDLKAIGDGPIPDDFRVKENPEILVMLAKAEERLEQLQNMSARQFKAFMLNTDASGAISLHNSRMLQGKKNAESLAKELAGWLPPTEEHQVIKDKMAAELQRRIEECSLKLPETEEQVTSRELLNKKIAAQKMYVERLETKVVNEKARVEAVNAWLDQLRQSLISQPARKVA